jgi:type I restriction enzyme S subunit
MDQIKLNQENLNSIKIPKPSFKEQESISRILESISDKNEREERRKEKLQQLKRGLMQDLLTGTVRVPESIEVED